MRLRTYALVAAMFFICGKTAPAEAQDIGAIIDLAASASSVAKRTSYDPCRFYSGIQKINCRVQNVRYKASQAKALGDRIADQRRRAQQRRDALNGEPVYNRASVQTCSWGDQSACRALGINKEQAAQMLSASGSQINMRAATVSAGAVSSSPASTRKPLDENSHLVKTLRRACNNGDQSACTYLGG